MNDEVRGGGPRGARALARGRENTLPAARAGPQTPAEGRDAPAGGGTGTAKAGTQAFSRRQSAHESSKTAGRAQTEDAAPAGNGEGAPDLVTLIDEPAWKTVLLDLVRKEQMDVWDIDVADLAAKYLERIRRLEAGNLRVPANAVLCSAILLGLKARALRLSFSDEEDPLPAVSREEVEALNAALPELVPVSKLREGRVSLEELMGHIEAIMEQSAKKSRRAAERRARAPPAFAVPVLSEKDMLARMEEVLARARAAADEKGLARFSSLLDASDPFSVVETFLALLFLFHKGRVGLLQASFFGDIIVLLPPASATGHNA